MIIVMFIHLNSQSKKRMPSFCVKHLQLVLTLAWFSFFSVMELSAEEISPEHQAWLKNQFSEQHQQLIPIVAVADMYFSCNQERKVDATSISLEALVTQQSRAVLADKLINCLGEDDVKSDVALNFGLLGCFHQQLGHLPHNEKAQKMVIVEKAILALSREERQQSFTKCVNAQAIHYLK